MPQPNDLSRSLVALDQNSTIIAVVELSHSSWLVAGMLPGIERQPCKKLDPSPERLLAVLHRWRDEAVRAGRTITRIALAFEAGRDGFWLARWLAARGVEAHVIHASSVAVSREHRRAKTDRLDTELLKRGFLGWLRGERGHCSMARVPTIAEEDAKRPNRERECLVGERTRIVNRIKSTLARLGIRNFKPTLRKAAEHLATVHTPEGMPLPPNTLAELQRDMARLGFVVGQIREIEDARQKRLEQQPESGPHAMVRRLARIVGVGVETADMLVHEVLSRPMRDRRAVARYAGLTGSPDESGAQRREHRRCSAATGYLKPALGRCNLSVRTDVMTTRVAVEKGRAIGVEILEGGRPTLVRAEREVIVCAGAIGSPKLLMLSGIGPAAHLGEHEIAVVQDLPGVGKNLQDHIDIDTIYELNGPHSYDKYKKLHWKLLAGLEYKMFGKGPVVSNLVEGGAFWWGDRAEATPDLQFHFLPGAGVEEGIGAVPGGNGCTLNSYHLRPRSRGSVTLRSSNPLLAPVIDPNVFAEPYDLARAVDGVKICREIMAQSAFSRFIAREHAPGDAVRSAAEYQAFARQAARSAYHPVGTCKMGADERAVVDPQLRVRGIDGLRVCDNSIMPRLISSNTNAAAIMIGEKASDLVRGNRMSAP